MTTTYAPRYYLCSAGHWCAADHKIARCPLATCKEPVRRVTAGGNDKEDQ